jgi:hypothetical protein
VETTDALEAKVRRRAMGYEREVWYQSVVAVEQAMYMHKDGLLPGDRWALQAKTQFVRRTVGR